MVFGLTMVGHGLDYEVVEPFFSLRLHPYTSLRGSACGNSQVAQAQWPDTEYSLRPSRDACRLNQPNAWPRRVKSTCHHRLVGRREGLFFT